MSRVRPNFRAGRIALVRILANTIHRELDTHPLSLTVLVRSGAAHRVGQLNIVLVAKRRNIADHPIHLV